MNYVMIVGYRWWLKREMSLRENVSVKMIVIPFGGKTYRRDYVWISVGYTNRQLVPVPLPRRSERVLEAHLNLGESNFRSGKWFFFKCWLSEGRGDVLIVAVFCTIFFSFSFLYIIIYFVLMFKTLLYHYELYSQLLSSEKTTNSQHINSI